MKCTRIGLAAMTSYIVLTLAVGANAAHSLSNSLTGFTGDSSQAGHPGGGRGRGVQFFHNRRP